MSANDGLMIEALRRKQSYRTAARNLSWEQKIASIERMREASQEAKRSMVIAKARIAVAKPK